MPSQNLTVPKLIDLCEVTRAGFSDTFFPLAGTQLQAIQRCSTLIQQNPRTIHKNVPKLRAHTILSEFWGHCPELFILCALSTYPSILGTLKSSNYIQVILQWWQGVEHPKGLTAVLTHYANILPEKPSLACVPSYRAHLEESDLFKFLEKFPGPHRSLTIRVPDDDNQMPAIEIPREMCQDLIRFVMERTKERMDPTQV